MKKILYVITIISVLLLLVACTKETNNNDNLNVEHEIETNEQQDVNMEMNKKTLADLTEEEKTNLENETAILLKDWLNIEAAMSFDSTHALELLGLEYKGTTNWVRNLNKGFMFLNAQNILSEVMIADDEDFVYTGILYEDFKEAMLKYLSEDYFNSKYHNGEQFREKDGMLVMKGSGASGVYYYSVVSELIAFDGEIYKFSVDASFNDGGGLIIEKCESEMIMTDEGIRINNDMNTLSYEDTIDINYTLISNSWCCYAVEDKNTGEEVEMSLFFGSGLKNNPGELKFYEDETFKNILPGISSDERSTYGTYMIDGNKIILNYNDDNLIEEGEIIISEASPVFGSKIEIVTEACIMKFKTLAGWYE